MMEALGGDVVVKWKSVDNGQLMSVKMKSSSLKSMLYKRSGVPVWASSVHLGHAHTIKQEKKVTGKDSYSFYDGDSAEKVKSCTGPSRALDEPRTRFYSQWESGSGTSAIYTDFLYDEESLVVIKGKAHVVHLDILHIYTKEQLDPFGYKKKAAAAKAAAAAGGSKLKRKKGKKKKETSSSSDDSSSSEDDDGDDDEDEESDEPKKKKKKKLLLKKKAAAAAMMKKKKKEPKKGKKKKAEEEEEGKKKKEEEVKEKKEEAKETKKKEAKEETLKDVDDDEEEDDDDEEAKKSGESGSDE